MNNLTKRATIIGIISISFVLILGLVLGLVLKFNTNFEVGGYSQFVVSINSTDKTDVKKATNTISEVLNQNNLKFETVLTSTEGEGTKFVVRYQNIASQETVTEVNNLLNEKLELTSSDISHIRFEGKLNQVVAHTAIVLSIVVVAFSIFVTIKFARYTGLIALISAVLGTALYLSITAILRLTVGMTYFAILIILNLIIMYYEILLFEGIKNNSNDAVAEIKAALIANRKNMSILAIGIAIVSLLFVIIAPTSLKFVSLNLMFVPVVCLVIGLYVAPFFMCAFAKLFSKQKSKLKSK